MHLRLMETSPTFGMSRTAAASTVPIGVGPVGWLMFTPQCPFASILLPHVTQLNTMYFVFKTGA